MVHEHVAFGCDDFFNLFEIALTFLGKICSNFV